MKTRAFAERTGWKKGLGLFVLAFALAGLPGCPAQDAREGPSDSSSSRPPSSGPASWTPHVKVGPHRFDVDLALTRAERHKGLGGRKSLPADRGMLFIYPRREHRYFWMKEMHIAIDMVWIVEDRIVHIHHDVRPEPQAASTADLTRYRPGQPVDKVLELAAGTCRAKGIRKGDRVVLHIEKPE